MLTSLTKPRTHAVILKLRAELEASIRLDHVPCRLELFKVVIVQDRSSSIKQADRLEVRYVVRDVVLFGLVRSGASCKSSLDTHKFEDRILWAIIPARSVNLLM
jgi:hypothetical protein